MNRVIKFRGKSLHTGEWHYGNLMQVGDACYIHEPGTAGFFTDPETVGQFTELYDCKGNGIYDGDILGAKGKVIGWVKGGVRGYCYDVVYVNHPAGESRWTLYSTVKDDYPEQIEVIGNIYDNSELLKGGNYGTQDKH